MDIKATQEQKSPEIRRSSRPRKSALAAKLGEAIPITQIAETSVPCLVAHVELTTADVNGQDQPIVTPQNNQNPIPETLPSLCSSEEIMCTEIHMETEIPEITRNDDLHDATPAAKTTSSRYILDKPRTTEETFSKNFEEAMNILHAISPVRGISMTFQRVNEKEKKLRNKLHHTPHPEWKKTYNQKIPVPLRRKKKISEFSLNQKEGNVIRTDIIENILY